MSVSPRATLEVICRQFPCTPKATSVLCLQEFSGDGSLSLSQNRPEALGDQCLQERPSTRERNPALLPQWNNSEMCSAQFLNKSQQDWVSTTLRGAWLVHTPFVRFSPPLVLLPCSLIVLWDHFQMNSVYQILVLGSAFGGTQTKTKTKPSVHDSFKGTHQQHWMKFLIRTTKHRNYFNNYFLNSP